MIRPSPGSLLLSLLCVSAPLCAAGDFTFFESEIRPLLAEHCYRCHSEEAEELKAGFRLDSRDGLLRGGESGFPALVPGEPDKSRLLTAVTYGDEDLQMPPKERLPAKEVAALRKWISDGAPWPGADNSIRKVDRVTEEDRSFWSFVPPERPPLPKVRDKSRVRTPIDRFVLAKLEENGLALSPDADPRVLLRRVTYNLTGLPPTPSEIRAFTEAFARDREAAVEALVERLLASPHYGERWGRHWLDVAGWSESSLFIGDNYHPGFWRYRDYVIRSFNGDKPYDQFLIEQLAGDELFNWSETDEFSEEQLDQLIATGFLRCTPDATDNQFITQDEKIYAAQQQSVEVACKALLGLTMNCVRCHSHKYDPVPQEDYYRVIAIFQAAYDPENWIPGQHNKLGAGPIRAIPILKKADREAFARDLEAAYAERAELNYQKDLGVRRKFRDLHLSKSLSNFEDAGRRRRIQTALEKRARERTPMEEGLVLAAAADLGITTAFLKEMYPDYAKELNQIDARRNKIKEEGMTKLPEVIWGLWDASTEPSPTRFLYRGDFDKPRHKVAPGVLEVLDDPGRPFQLPETPPHPRTTGRRLAFAQWLTHPDHPLTARVMVNRVWQQHFGTGIVATPDDFGKRGARPTHPALLDWLAVEFVESGWSLKHLHRLILLSSTYRQSSVTRNSAADPANKLLRHYPRRRLEAEAVRDGMLAASGLLDRTMFGKSVRTPKQTDGRYAPAPDDPGRHRRSIYLWTKRTELPTFLTTFDAPIMDTNWPVRSDSAVSQQALALMNDPFMHECGGHFAARLLEKPKIKFRDRLKHAFLLAYGRSPESGEMKLFRQFHRRQPDKEAGWKAIAHALLSSNEFLYLD